MELSLSSLVLYFVVVRYDMYVPFAGYTSFWTVTWTETTMKTVVIKGFITAV